MEKLNKIEKMLRHQTGLNLERERSVGRVPWVSFADRIFIGNPSRMPLKSISQLYEGLDLGEAEAEARRTLKAVAEKVEESLASNTFSKTVLEDGIYPYLEIGVYYAPEAKAEKAKEIVREASRTLRRRYDEGSTPVVMEVSLKGISR